MLHRVIGWFQGYVKIKLYGCNLERFVNLCRNHGINLWQLYWSKKGDVLYLRILLQDFYRLRPIARKCKVRPLVVKRYGFPFLVGKMKRNWSFCFGIFAGFFLILFLSTRIWGITIEGESFHTKESILNYLNGIDIYGGMAKNKLKCNEIEEKIRKKYNDIGWASVEIKGSRIIVHVREVILIPKKIKQKRSHLIASESGKIVSIVTRKGSAKVHENQKVKKGKILISGEIDIYGDNQEIMEKKYVPAEGTIILELSENYQSILDRKYKKRIYTKREKSVHEWDIDNKKFFYHNPLNNLETYEKYDIIRDGGQLCSFLSLRFPIRHYVKTFREIIFQNAQYTRTEAKKILYKKYKYYLQKKRKEGYRFKSKEIALNENKNNYVLQGKTTFLKKQTQRQRIYKKNLKIDKDSKSNGNDGNGN